MQGTPSEGCEAGSKNNTCIGQVGIVQRSSGLTQTAYALLSDLSRGVTGEVLHVDPGFHVVGIPAPGTADARNGGEPGNGTAAATSDPG